MNDNLTKYAAVGATVCAGVIGWAMIMESRTQAIQTTLSERASIIDDMSNDIDALKKVCNDPSPKPETRVAIDALRVDLNHIDGRLNRIEDRVNNFHNYLMALPVKPLPFKPYQKGDLDMPMFGAN